MHLQATFGKGTKINQHKSMGYLQVSLWCRGFLTLSRSKWFHYCGKVQRFRADAADQRSYFLVPTSRCRISIKFAEDLQSLGTSIESLAHTIEVATSYPNFAQEGNRFISKVVGFISITVR